MLKQFLVDESQPVYNPHENLINLKEFSLNKETQVFDENDIFKILNKTYKKVLETIPQNVDGTTALPKNKKKKIHKILVIEDDYMSGELLKDIVEQIGQKVVIENNPNNAIKIIKKERFDLIFLDIIMPKINGYELFQQIKINSINSETPVLFMSSLNDVHNIMKGIDLGSHGYITKPFNIDELKNKIKSVLNIKDLQNELKEKQEIFDSINKFSEDGIVIVDEKFNIIFGSQKFLSWFKTKNIIDENLHMLIQSRAGCHFDLFNPQKYIELSLPDNEKIFIKAKHSKIVDSSNRKTGYLFMFSDVTKKRETEEQKENFIATLTHDLKTPVRAEMYSLELLLKGSFGKLTDAQQEIIQEILYSSKFMFSMIDTLLTKYRYENANIMLNIEEFDINKLIKDCLSELKYLIKEKNHELVFKPKEHRLIFADKIEIKRVINNFLSNAIKYTNKGGRIEITSEIKDGHLITSIKDNGKGISKAKLNNIFDKYVSYSQRLRQVGTGLGLYVSKKIIDAHHGEILVESKVNQGSIFTFKIPANIE